MRFAIVLITLFCASSSSLASEAPPCNSLDVLNALQDGTIGKMRKWALAFIASQPSGPETPSIQTEVETL
jgi:hypothetical protein